MSHTVKVGFTVKESELPALGRAAMRLGAELVLGQKTFKQYYKTRKCTHAIRIPGNKKAFEVGLIQQNDGTFNMMGDEFAGGLGMVDVVGRDMCKLKPAYAEEIVKDQYQSDGFQILSRVEREDGWIVMEAVS